MLLALTLPAIDRDTNRALLAGFHTAMAGFRCFYSVGFAIEDFSALRYVRDAVVGTNFCEHIGLVADPEDPKDLFWFVNALSPVGS